MTLPAVCRPSSLEESHLSDTSFGALGVPAPLVRALAADGITAPFPTQISTLPDTMAGRDVLGRGRTGSGKTLAFSLPLVARLAASRNPGHNRGRSGRARSTRPGYPRGLVLAPTREPAPPTARGIPPLAAGA